LHLEHRSQGRMSLSASIQLITVALGHLTFGFLTASTLAGGLSLFIVTKGSPSNGLHCSKAPVSSYSS
nr:hypothetical protein [Tanacetum cinerariifolium]